MNLVTLFAVLLFVLNANVLHYNANPITHYPRTHYNYGIGRFDQDVDLKDSLIDRTGRNYKVDDGFIYPQRKYNGKNLR